MVDLVLRNFSGEIARKEVPKSKSPGMVLVELLTSNDWMLETGDMVSVEETESEDE